MDDKETKRENMIKKLSDKEKQNVADTWAKYAESLSEEGQEIMQGRIDWLKSLIPSKIKNKKKKKKKKKGKKNGKKKVRI